MRVGQYSNIATGNTLSGSKKIGGVSLPDFNDFHYNTKTSPAMSDDQFKESIISQAKKDYAAGKYQNNADCRRLQKQFVSVVSPDRKNLISESLTKITKNNPQPKTLNILELLLGKVKYEKSNEGLSYAEFYDNAGNLVASYSNNGWYFYGTKEEFARETEFNLMYSEAWRNADNAAKSANVATEVNLSTSNESSIDIKA